MPHVQGVMVGQKVKIVNSDPTLHNIHAHAKANPEFNQGQPFQGMEMEKMFDKAEVMIPFRCDVHPWMASYMGVLDHPFFAVSKADGSFEIANLPPGTLHPRGLARVARHADRGRDGRRRRAGRRQLRLQASGVDESRSRSIEKRAGPRGPARFLST